MEPNLTFLKLGQSSAQHRQVPKKIMSYWSKWLKGGEAEGFENYDYFDAHNFCFTKEHLDWIRG